MSHGWNQLVRSSLAEGIELKHRLMEMAEQIARAGELVVQALARGGRLYFVGNGGSAADAQHLATELIGRFEDVNRLPAVALTADSSTLTALSNDFGFEEVFSRQVEALVRPGDLLVALSTSGRSPNILAAVRRATALGATVLGLTGHEGGELAALCHHCVVVPSRRTCRIQEGHIAIGHILCEIVEAARREGRLVARAGR